MPSNILIEIFETMDHFNLLPRMNDVVPFVILDGYGSRVELLLCSISMTLLMNGVYVYVSHIEQNFGMWVIVKNEIVFLIWQRLNAI